MHQKPKYLTLESGLLVERKLKANKRIKVQTISNRNAPNIKVLIRIYNSNFNETVKKQQQPQSDNEREGETRSDAVTIAMQATYAFKLCVTK